MKRARVRILMAIAIFLNVSGVYAQNAEKPAYLNPALLPQQRAGEIAPDSAEGRWLRWAHSYADWLGPLKNGGFEESLRRIT